MPKTQPPGLIALDSDKYHAEYVGHLKNGLQIFITTPFIPETDANPGRAFVAVYLFDPKGVLVEARIEDLGTNPFIGQAQACIEKHVARLGCITPGRIWMKPFELERFGTKFGFIPRPPEDETDSWWVEAHPGNFMAFHEPFDRGEYDT
jgi:hypothetical protein